MVPKPVWLRRGLVGCEPGAEPAAEAGLEPRPRPVEAGPEAEPRDAGPSKPPGGADGAPKLGRDEVSERFSLGLAPRPRRRAVPLMMMETVGDDEGVVGWYDQYEK